MKAEPRDVLPAGPAARRGPGVAALRLLLAAATVVAVAGCTATAPPPPVPVTPPSATSGPTATGAPTTTTPAARTTASPARPSTSRTAAAVSLATFAGDWNGHTRFLTVSASGVGHETVSDGCCTPEIDLSFRLSQPRGTSAARATATATVTAVTLYALPGPKPAVGTTMTVSLVDGVLTNGLDGFTYCNRAAGARSACGA